MNASLFTYGMTNPALSNSLSVLIAVDTALHGDQGTLRKFFSSQAITSGSTGNLTDQFRGAERHRYAHRRPGVCSTTCFFQIRGYV